MVFRYEFLQHNRCSSVTPDALLTAEALSIQKAQRRKKFPRLLSGLGNDRGTDRNRRVSATLSPIFYLFLAPSGILYLKVQQLLTHGETPDASPPPIVGKRRPGPKHPNYGIPAEHWPTVVQRVVEKKEPLHSIAAAFGVSHETIRRLLLRVQRQHGQQAY
jgi:hypothetical protein